MQAGLDEGLRGDGLTSDKHAELNRLRRENRVLREEREILSQAAAHHRLPNRANSTLYQPCSRTLHQATFLVLTPRFQYNIKDIMSYFSATPPKPISPFTGLDSANRVETTTRTRKNVAAMMP